MGGQNSGKWHTNIVYSVQVVVLRSVDMSVFKHVQQRPVREGRFVDLQPC
jgi:hypothetical protein